MYLFLLFLHSLVRWVVLTALLYAIYVAFRGVSRQLSFTSQANSIRHWTATAAHIQLMIGMTLYFQSPVVKYGGAGSLIDPGNFFRYIHSLLMIIAVVIITIGSAKAKRMSSDRGKYQTMLRWFTSGLLVILLAIPWPFYETLARPLIRPFETLIP